MPGPDCNVAATFDVLSDEDGAYVIALYDEEGDEIARVVTDFDGASSTCDILMNFMEFEMDAAHTFRQWQIARLKGAR